MRFKKRKKKSRLRGRGTAGRGARKKARKSGHKGGGGMSGSGKRADHKKTLITKLYGHGYFGKKGITSKRTVKSKEDKINLSDIESQLGTFLKKGVARKTEKGVEINLESYSILGKGEVTDKLFIIAKKASKSAIEKIKKAGGGISLKQKEVRQKDGVE